MRHPLGRRGFLQGVVAATVVAFDSQARAWVPAGPAAGGSFEHVPSLDGELLTDVASREAVSQEVGGLARLTPAAVLRPGSISDVAKMVNFCATRRIKVAARGQGFSTDGQSQSEAGLVIDMRALAEVHEVGEGYALVDAGATWRQLLEATLRSGQTPPVLTRFNGLSVGGTLSMGGMSGMAYNKGGQVEHVLELKVVTGLGQVEVCSLEHNRALFEAVLAGVGQYAVIVQAKVKLEPAPERVRECTVRYHDLGVFMEDMRTLVARGEFDAITGGIKYGPRGWFYELNTTRSYNPPSLPDVGHALRGLRFERGSLREGDEAYLEYQTRVDQVVDLMRSIGVWDGAQHPWFNVFVPDRQVVPYVGGVMASLTPEEDIGRFGAVMLFPLLRSKASRPLLRLPEDELVFLFDVLTSAEGHREDEGHAQRMRARNRQLFEAARAVGSTRYPVGTLDFTREDWRQHYGEQWAQVVLSKNRYDPQGILTPGPGIFGPDADAPFSGV